MAKYIKQNQINEKWIIKKQERTLFLVLSMNWSQNYPVTRTPFSFFSGA